MLNAQEIEKITEAADKELMDENRRLKENLNESMSLNEQLTNQVQKLNLQIEKLQSQIKELQN